MRAEGVTPVARGAWAIPVEIPLPGLTTVLVYAFELPRGLLLVDCGWSSSRSFASLEAGLAAMGAPLRDIVGLVCTHAHGDHYGLAGQVREASHGWIALHPAEMPFVEARRGGSARAAHELDLWLDRAGVADAQERLTMLPGDGIFSWEFPAVLPDVLLTDGQHLDFPGWDFEVIHTPGHTPGHVCLIERTARLVLTGDAVLPRITPNISASPHAEDPLSDYFCALDRLAGLNGFIGLPGHEMQLPSVADRAVEIRTHHEHQLGETLELVRSGAETVRDVAERMPWSRPWRVLAGYDRRAALGEAQAHLIALERRGKIVRVEEQPLRWGAAA